MDRSAYSQELLRIVRTCNVNQLKVLMGLVDVNVRDEHKRTPLHLAVTYNKNPEVVRTLLEHKEINVNAKDELGRTALHLAVAFNKNPEVVRRLLHHKDIDVNAKDELGRTALHLCVFNHKEELLKPGEAARQTRAGIAFVQETLEQWVGIGPSKTGESSSQGNRSSITSGESGEEDEQGIQGHEAESGGIYSGGGSEQEEEIGEGSLQDEEIEEEEEEIGGDEQDEEIEEEELQGTNEYEENNEEDYSGSNSDDNDSVGYDYGGYYKGNEVKLASMILKKEGVDVNIAVEVIHMTPLHLAARLGHVKMVQQLLKSPKLRLSKRTTDGHTALHLVAEGHSRSHIPNGVRKPTMEDLCKVICLIRETGKKKRSRNGEERGKSNMVNMRDCLGRTALHYAAQDGCISLVKELLEFKEDNERFQMIDVNVEDIYGYTPLHLVVRGGYTPADVANHPKNLKLGPLKGVTKLLLEVDGININLQSSVARSEWKAPDIEPCTEIHTDYFIRPMLISWPLYMDKDGSWHNTPLHFAARDGHAEIVQVLLHEQEIDLTLEDNYGRTGLQVATQNGHLDVVQKLLLHHAAREGCKKVVEILHVHDKAEVVEPVLKEAIRRAGNPQGPDTNPMFLLLINLLEVATEHEHEDVAKFLLNILDRSGLVRDQKNSKGGNLLHWAVKNGNLRIVQYVVKWSFKSSMINAQDNHNLTPLHYAIMNFEKQDSEGVFFQIFQEVLSFKDLDVNIHGSTFDYTPLHIAAQIGNTAVVTLLCTKAGERLRANEEDTDKKTPLEIAVESLNYFLEDKDARELAIQRDNTKSLEQIQAELDKERKEASARRHIKMLLLDRSDVKDYLERLYRDRQTYVDAANALLVGAALIAGVAFVGWLQPPSGYTDTGIVKITAASQCFFIFNALAFFGGVAAVIAGAHGALLDEETFIRNALETTRKALMWAITLLMVSVVCVLGAFVSAGIVVYQPTNRKQLIGFGLGLTLGVLACLIAMARFATKVLRKKKPCKPYAKVINEDEGIP